MDVAQQVISIYCGTKGHLDSLKTAQVLKFEAGLLDFVKSNYAEVMEDIAKKEKIEDWAEKRIIEAIESYKKMFLGGDESK